MLKGPGKMKSDAERCAEYEKFKKIDAAFRAGDFSALAAAVDDPDSIPTMPLTIGPCLEYAINHSRRLRCPDFQQQGPEVSKDFSSVTEAWNLNPKGVSL